MTDMCTREELRQEIHQLRKDIKPILKAMEEGKLIERIDRNTEQVSELYALLHKEGVEGRSVFDDLKLVRDLYHRFSGFASVIGFIIGIFTVGIPLVLGFMKLWSMISKALR